MRTPVPDAPRRQPVISGGFHGSRTPPSPISFFVHGNAARSTQGGSIIPVKTKGGKVFNRLTRRNTAWSSLVGARAQDHALTDLWEGPVHIAFVAYIARPKKPRHPTAPITRPDIDNMTKGVLDLFKGIFFQDDSQVTKKTEEKVYTPTGATGLQVTVTFLP